MLLRWRSLGLVVAVALTGTWAHAKRSAPKEVAPRIAEGVRYTVPHFGAFHGKSQNGGYVQAWDVKTGRLMWDRLVYRVRYEASREKDVQDDFITDINVKGGSLLVKTERGEEFEMNIRSGEVRAITPLGRNIELGTGGAHTVQPGVAADGAAPRR